MWAGGKARKSSFQTEQPHHPTPIPKTQNCFYNPPARKKILPLETPFDFPLVQILFSIRLSFPDSILHTPCVFCASLNTTSAPGVARLRRRGGATGKQDILFLPSWRIEYCAEFPNSLLFVWQGQVRGFVTTSRHYHISRTCVLSLMDKKLHTFVSKFSRLLEQGHVLGNETGLCDRGHRNPKCRTLRQSR